MNQIKKTKNKHYIEMETSMTELPLKPDEEAQLLKILLSEPDFLDETHITRLLSLHYDALTKIKTEEMPTT